MTYGGRGYENTVGFSTHWRWRGTGVCVIAAGWPTIFTTFMGGVGRLRTGESITAAYGVFVEDVTRLDMKGNEDDYQ